MSRQVSEEELVEMGEKIRLLLPGAVWDTDNDGQLIIYTDLWQVSDSQVVEGAQG